MVILSIFFHDYLLSFPLLSIILSSVRLLLHHLLFVSLFLFLFLPRSSSSPFLPSIIPSSFSGHFFFSPLIFIRSFSIPPSLFFPFILLSPASPFSYPLSFNHCHPNVSGLKSTGFAHRISLAQCAENNVTIFHMMF